MSLQLFARRFVSSPSRRSFSASPSSNADFTHAVIGGGVVGLAIGRQLAARPGASVLLIERHNAVGTETSSRNSEVIHAGLYYGHGTLKTTLCLKGKRQLYALCAKHAIPHRNTKKWIIAQDDQQMHELEKVHTFASAIDVPTRFLSRDEIQTREPDVRAEAGVLESETTGIVDSHSLMTYLQGDLEDRGGDLAFGTAVTRIDPVHDGQGGYRVYTKAAGSDEEDVIEVESVINSAGLGAIQVNNLVLPAERHRKPFYAKGSYFSYAAGHPKPKTLLYPAPVPGHGGLGTHLTLDMAGRVRFGPDVEWIDDPNDLTPNESRLPEAIDMIQTYLPKVKRDAIALDYCGIRPKLGKTSNTSGPNFADFYIREEEGFPGFINLLGIESPGLTSALAIAEYVDKILYSHLSGQADEAHQKGDAPRFEFDH